VLVGHGMLEDTQAFRPEVRQVLKKLCDGHAEDVYDGASEVLRQTLLKDKFLAIADRLRRTLGGFKQVGKINDVEYATTSEGRVAYVKLELEFEHGHTTGELSFHHRTGRWLLLGVRIPIPDRLEAQWSSLEHDYDEVSAPEEVVALANHILTDIAEGNGAIVYEQASDTFKQSVSVEFFRDLLVAHDQALGHYLRTLSVISSAQNSDKTRARVFALLEYERGKTTGSLEFVKAPAQARNPRRAAAETDATVSNTWQLSRFKIWVPEPRSPSETTGTDGR
jgi:hypothetical protein